MKITLASFDHFHILNQAQYLLKEGHLQDYFSTRLRPKIEKVPSPKNHSCYPLHYGLRVMQRWPQWVGGNYTYLQLCRLFDYWLCRNFSLKSDLLVVLSGVGLKSFRKARANGMKTVVDCGSTHTDFQHQIVLEEFRRNGFNAPLFPKGYCDRVREEFLEADYIQIPSHFVGKTFLDHGIPESKLLYAPYGVHLETFRKKDELKKKTRFRAICASGVNLRKGARILVEAWRKLAWHDAELHWVGSPTLQTEHLFKKTLPGLMWHPLMSHRELAELYRQCDVMVLPSFEEGLARVIIEAAASGLPGIVTPNSGAEEFFTPGNPEGWLIPVNNVDALCEALQQAKFNREATFVLGQRAAERAQLFSWDAYGKKVVENYQSILSKNH